MKTLADFQPEPLEWLIDDWLPFGHRGMDTAPEGSFKTILGCWLGVCIASGNPVFGHEVTQGPVLFIDEETPQASLDNHLIRFAQGIGFKLEELPIYRVVMTGFRFGRKTEMDKLLKWIETVKPVFIRMDSMLAMLPSGRQGFSENDCHLGEAIRDDLITILNNASTKCSILLSAHAKKFIGGVSMNELADFDMSRIVRGHGSIVGEGCDTGFVIKKVSEQPPTRFLIQVRARRQAIPAGRPILVEIEEEKYGRGWARLKEIDSSRLPPSYFAKSLFPIFLAKNKSGDYVTYKETKIAYTCALKTKSDCKEGLLELWNKKVIVKGNFIRSYTLNPFVDQEVDADYLKHLRNSHKELYI